MKEIINPNMTMGKAQIPIEKVTLGEDYNDSSTIYAYTNEGRGSVEMYEDKVAVIIYERSKKAYLKKIYPITFGRDDVLDFVENPIEFKLAKAKKSEFPLSEFIVNENDYHEAINQAKDLCQLYASIVSHWHFHSYVTVNAIDKHINTIKYLIQFGDFLYSKTDLLKRRNSYIDANGMLYISIEANGLGCKSSIWDAKNELENFETGGLVGGEGDTWQTKGLHYVIPCRNLKINQFWKV